MMVSRILRSEIYNFYRKSPQNIQNAKATPICTKQVHRSTNKTFFQIFEIEKFSWFFLPFWTNFDNFVILGHKMAKNSQVIQNFKTPKLLSVLLVSYKFWRKFVYLVKILSILKGFRAIKSEPLGVRSWTWKSKNR